MSFKLGTKVSTAAAIPTAAFLVMSFVLVKNNLDNRNMATHAEEDMHVVGNISKYVHELQKERARSVAYTNGAGSREEMDAQRQLADQKKSLYVTVAKHADISEAALGDVSKAIEYHENTTRRQINGREIAAGEVIQRFNGFIDGLLGFALEMSGNHPIEGSAEKIRSIAILERAKESSGRLRANMVGILAANKAITDQQLSTLTGVQAGVEANLYSPGLVITKDSKYKIQSFKSTGHWQKVDEVYKLILKKAEVGGFNEDPKAFIGTITQVVDDVGVVVANEIDDYGKYIEESLGSAGKAVWVISTIVVALTAFLVMFLYFIVRAITKPVNKVIGDLRSSGTQVASASEQLQSVSQQLSSGATEAAASLEETVSSLESLSHKVKLNADHAQEASTLSQASRSSAEEGEGEIRRLVSAMSDISQSSKKIEEIINVIDDIAFQTNLLALNAAVEAARAGEQGRGFAVVADAVRNLAQRSASAAKEITALIKDSVSQIEQGSKIADNSGASLKNIVISVKKVADLNNEIAAASQDQATGISQLNKAMTDLDQTTQSNAASAEEASASSEEMSAQSVAMQNLVADLAFVVDGRKESFTTAYKTTHHKAGAGPGTKYDHHQNRNVAHHTPTQPTYGQPAQQRPHLKVVEQIHASTEQTRDPKKVIPFESEHVNEKVGTTNGF